MVKGKRKKIKNGLMGDKKFGDDGGARKQRSRGGARLHSGDIHVGRVRRGSHSDSAGGQLQE